MKKGIDVSLDKIKMLGLTVAMLCLVSKAVLAFEPEHASQWMVITNPTAFERVAEVVAVKRSLLKAGNPSLVPQIKRGSAVLISQLVDDNNDGYWDELLVQLSLAPYAKDTLQIEWIARNNAIAFPTYTNVRLSLRSDTKTPSPEINAAMHLRGFAQNIAKPFYQMEGPGIENDKVAFRAFFDVRNGKDIYGKITDTPVLEGVGVGASWHELQPWGMDIFRTGSSLGAGGLAVEENGKIYRLGDADTAAFTALYEGPLKAAFRLRFSNWDVAEAKQPGSETISLAKGAFYYQNDIILSLPSFQKLIAGMANFGTDKVVYVKHNAQFSSVSMYGPQAEGTKTKLGVAILFPSGDYVQNQTTDTASVIPNTTIVALKQHKKKTIYFFACWEKTDPRFSREEGFRQYLQQSAERLARPVQVKIIQKPA